MWNHIWKLIRANEEPDETQRLNADFMAVWNQVNQGIAAANARVKHLVKDGKKPSQEEMDASPALAIAWKCLGGDVCFIATIHCRNTWLGCK